MKIKVKYIASENIKPEVVVTGGKIEYKFKEDLESLADLQASVDEDRYQQDEV